MTDLDRDGVIAILTGLASETADVEGAADRILALVGPVQDRWAEGFAKGYHAAAAIFHGPVPRLVTLTPEEARIAAAWYTGDPQAVDSGAELALARKLEDAS